MIKETNKVITELNKWFETIDNKEDDIFEIFKTEKGSLFIKYYNGYIEEQQSILLNIGILNNEISWYKDIKIIGFETIYNNDAYGFVETKTTEQLIETLIICLNETIEKKRLKIQNLRKKFNKK